MMISGRWPAVLLVGLLVCMPGVRAAARPTPVVLDTDIGGDIDDAFALALILDSPELDLQAVTTVSGDAQARARIAAKMLWVAGRRGVPVAAGAASAVSPMPQAKWAEGFTSPELLSESAVALMKTAIDRGHGATVVMAIGPLTNVAALLREHPEEKQKIRRIVLMGGSIARGYYPNSGPTNEYNIAADAAAAQAVFGSGVPITMAPLDVTARLQLEEPERERIFARHTPLTDALQALYTLWGQPTPTLHDPMAVAMFLNPGICTTRELAVQVDDHGMTRAITGRAANAVVGVEIEPARFIKFYVGRVGR